MVYLVRDGETLLSGGNAVWQVAVRRGLQGLAVIVEGGLPLPAMRLPVGVATGVVAEDEQAHFADAATAQLFFNALQQAATDVLSPIGGGDAEVVKRRAAAVFAAKQRGDEAPAIQQ